MRTLTDVVPGQYYRHYKGSFYFVRAIAQSADGEGSPLILYAEIGGDGRHWYHTPEEFLKLLPDGKERFAPCDVMEVVRGVDPKILEGLYFANANQLALYK